MIIAKVLHYMNSDEAAKLNWKSMTHDFNEASIDAFIDMQNNRQDKISVCDLILRGLKDDTQKHIHEQDIENKLLFIRKTIENGVYSPYREIERLAQENDIKDQQISELLAELNIAKIEGDEQKETDLITKIVEHSVKLGIDVARNVELVLGRIYRGTTKFSKHFKWLENYIANTASSSDILAAIAELNETLKRGVEENNAKSKIEIKEVVLQKHVGTEIQNVAAGGTGVNNEIKKD
ncbi:MAG: hypothetical protein IJ588_03085 [Prevotella sp.]|nr:hypothetical protein [Prevotella sp.]